MKRALTLGALAFSVMVPSLAFAEGESAPPGQADAWDQAMKAGLQQEGRKSGAELKQEQKENRADASAAEDLRMQLRFGAFALIGGAYNIRRGNEIGQSNEKGIEVAVGGVVKKGLSLSWELQGRVGLAFVMLDGRFFDDEYGTYSGSSSTSVGVSDHDHGSAKGAMMDATARYHFGGVTKPAYFGFGARADFLFYDPSITETGYIGSNYSGIPYADKKTSVTTLYVDPLALAEIGIVLGKDQMIDLSAHVAGGLGFRGGAAVSVVF